MRLFAPIENINQLPRQYVLIDDPEGREIGRGRGVSQRLRIHCPQCRDSGCVQRGREFRAGILGGRCAEALLLQFGGRDHVGALRDRFGKEAARLG